MKPVEQDLLAAAVLNNAAWCERVVEAHGCRGSSTGTYWWTNDPVPRFYPNLITLTSDGTVDQYRAIDRLRVERPKRFWGVKDSYAGLDLHARGFEVLFEATWYSLHGDALHADETHVEKGYTGEGTRDARRTPARIIPHEVSTRREFERWLDASAPDDPESSPPLPIELLNSSDTRLLAGMHEGRIVCGLALYAAAGVVGCSNLFEHDGAAGGLVRCLAHAARLFPGQMTVGYGASDELGRIAGAAPSALGPLRVWVHP